MRHGKKAALPYPKHLRSEENAEFAKEFAKPVMVKAHKPAAYRCEYCNGWGYLEARLNHYECYHCGGHGTPAISFYEMKGRVMNKREASHYAC